MSIQKKLFRLGFFALLALSMLLCPLANRNVLPGQSVSANGNYQDFTFVPQITPIEFHTEEAEYLATFAVFSGPNDLEKNAFFSSNYKRVSCGQIDDGVCFELCYARICIVYGNDDDRVKRFIVKVEDREKLINEFNLAQLEVGPRIVKIFGDCFKAGGSGMIAYGLFIFFVSDPEPVTKTIAGFLTGFGAMFVCGGSIWNGINQQKANDIIVTDIIEASKEVIYEFQDLERNPPE